ncbi:hypothetical protein GCM10010193_09890 [Kitasatospora atroaurantiaca]|uniref:Helix-turn-helix protein n=1 Tax=Kitasatospora atroaurantiaca TaxID=285545 RepID=A0A561ES61_9ACTN|nr:hypothetical protein [Kitasatospora atroaurantiaca]TWE18439.1 hypothetical protein FB465_3512 [Kitasatospora atroaurantiaca]
MQIHRNAHVRDFTVLPNAALRDRRLSFAARGLLAHLISLPDGSPETIRSLAEDNPDGRQGIATAFDELKRHGYFHVWRQKNPTTGQITTHTAVFDIAQVTPEPATADPGPRDDGTPGQHPLVKNQGEEPSLPPTEAPRLTPPPPQPPEPSATPVDSPEDSPVDSPEAAGMLFRLADAEPRLRIGVAEAATLAPLAAEWLARGATERDLRTALLPGLPRRIHCAAALLRSRLQSKMPPVPTPKPPAPERHECAHCRAPIPHPGICRPCAGVEPTPDTSGFIAATRRGAARARAAMHGRPTPALA